MDNYFPYENVSKCWRNVSLQVLTSGCVAFIFKIVHNIPVSAKWQWSLTVANVQRAVMVTAVQQGCFCYRCSDKWWSLSLSLLWINLLTDLKSLCPNSVWILWRYVQSLLPWTENILWCDKIFSKYPFIVHNSWSLLIPIVHY